jgi:hypothetical protein
MGLLDKLSSIIKIDVSKLKTIKLFSDNKKTEVTINYTAVNPSLYSPSDQDKLKKLLHDAVQVEDAIVIEDKSNKLLEDFSKVDSESRNRDTLNYFADKIPPGDLEVLRASLYLRKLHEERTNRELIKKVKFDIIRKYGERGANIANLCTAGYFESTIRPLYESMKGGTDFTSEKFISRYNSIILQVPFAVFVNRLHTEETLKAEVLNKIKINKKYGIKKLNIHAIGDVNVNKVRAVTRDIEIEKLFTKSPDIESGSGYFIITIWF